jgi:hypothetical protein
MAFDLVKYFFLLASDEGPPQREDVLAESAGEISRLYAEWLIRRN